MGGEFQSVEMRLRREKEEAEIRRQKEREDEIRRQKEREA